jgi:hypothetical protein
MPAALFPETVAGQIMWVQLLCSVSTVVPAASAPSFTRNQISPAYMQTSARVLPTTFCIMNIGDEYANAPTSSKAPRHTCVGSKQKFSLCHIEYLNDNYIY